MNLQEKNEFIQVIEQTIILGKRCNKGRFVHDMNSAIGRMSRIIEYKNKHGIDSITNEWFETLNEDQEFINNCIYANKRTRGN